MNAVQELRSHALTFPESEEGVVCNKSSFKAGNKNFFFLGEKESEQTWNFMLKLGESIPEADAIVAKDGRISVGKGGWISGDFPLGEAPDVELLKRWIEESYRLLVPKKIVAQLDA